MNKCQRRKAEHLTRCYPLPPYMKPKGRSKRARGKIRTSILGAGLNHRGRYPDTYRSKS